MSVWTSLCFWRAVFLRNVFCTAWSSWTSWACLFELHSVFWRAVFCTAWSSWTSGTCLFELHSVSLYCIFIIWSTHHVVRELPVVITLNFSLVWENYFKTQKTTYFFMYFGHLNIRLTSHKKFFWTFPRWAIELLSTILFHLWVVFKSAKNSLCFLFF